MLVGLRLSGPLPTIPFPESESVVAWLAVRAGEKLGQERRESGGPWRSKNRPPEICLRKRSQEERFVGYRRDVHSGAICTRSARGVKGGEKLGQRGGGKIDHSR